MLSAAITVWLSRPAEVGVTEIPAMDEDEDGNGNVDDDPIVCIPEATGESWNGESRNVDRLPILSSTVTVWSD